MQNYLHIGKASDLENKRDRRLYRLFEILPGLFAWVTLIGVVVLSFILPIFVAIFIIAFDVYWFIKTVYLSLHLRIAYKKLRENMKINWQERLERLPRSTYEALRYKHGIQGIRSWQDMYHLIFLPVYKEDFLVIAASLDGLLNTNYPDSKMIVVISWEERGGDETARTIRKIGEQYGSSFFKFVSIMHPQDMPREIPGKGSNTSYSAAIVKERIIDAFNIPYENVLVSNLDVDTVVFPDYFSILTYRFLTTDNPLKASYQPIPLYINNIWEAPSFARVVAFSATFWHTIKQEKVETATTFSSHSMPFKALLDVGYWQKNMVSEDSRIFWQCFIRYNGDYRVEPLFYPVSMDANVASTSYQTFKNVYKQQRRWGYGVENIPYFLFGFIKNKAIPTAKKWKYGLTVIEGFHSWATNAIIIFLLGWLPVVVGGPEFNKTIISYNLPLLTRTIMAFAMVGLISSAILSIVLLPPKPPQFGRFKYPMMILQWLLFPITMIGLGAFPGLEAQTRLMFGKYMGFWVTPKER